MREATQIDAEFKLAHVTLAGYEELINNARSGAEAARVSEDELKRLKRDKETKLGADIAERLQGLAKKGDKVDRLTAMSILATTYRGEAWGPLKMLFERGDAFYLERLSDNYNKAYWSGVGELAQMPPMPWGREPAPAGEPREVRPARTSAESRKDVQHGAEGQIADINYLFSGRHFARCLQADRRQDADVLERLYKLGLKQHPSADWKVKQQIELATEYRQVLDIDRSTAFLVQAQGLAKGSDELTKIAGLLEVNRAIEKAMSELGPKAELREYLQHYGPYANASSIEQTRKEFASGSLTPNIAADLVGYRDWPRDEHEYVLIGDEPVWRLHGGGALSTGPRLDALRADEIRYWERPDLRKQESDTLLVMGATPVDHFTAMFELRGEPPQDWRLGESREFERWQKAAPADQRPEVGIVFGLRNIGVPSRGHNPPGPLAGYAVCVGEDTVRLVTIAGNARPMGAPTVTTVQAWKVDLGADKKLAVQVQVDGSAVKVTVGGKTFTANVPADAAGFLGLRISGPGYGAIGGLRIARR